MATDNPSTAAVTNIVPQLAVEWDLNHDGVVDDRTWLNSDRDFTYLPRDVQYGSHEFRARVAQWDVATSSVRRGPWHLLEVQFVAAPPPTVVSFALAHNTGIDVADAITSDPTVSGTLLWQDGLPAEATSVYLDFNGDQLADARVWTDAQGMFQFQPHHVPAGLQTYSARSSRWDDRTGTEIFGPWTSLAITYEPAAAPRVDQLWLEPLASSADSTDARSYQIRGTLDVQASVEIELDIDEDGVADRFVLSEPDGTFAFEFGPAAGSAGGSHPVRARAAVWDPVSVILREGPWSDAWVQLPVIAPARIEIRHVGLRNDDGSSTSDLITSNPTIVGHAIWPDSAEDIYGWIEIDANSDGQPDGTAHIAVDGDFEVLFEAGHFGQHQVQLRAVTWDYGQREAVTGAWHSLHFNYELALTGSAQNDPAPMGIAAPINIATATTGVSTDLMASSTLTVFHWPEPLEHVPYEVADALLPPAPTYTGTPGMLQYRPELDGAYRESVTGSTQQYERALRLARDAERFRHMDAELERERQRQLLRIDAQRSQTAAIQRYHALLAAPHPTIDLTTEQLAHLHRLQLANNEFQRQIQAIEQDRRQSDERARMLMQTRTAEAQRQYADLLAEMQRYQRENFPRSADEFAAFNQRLLQYTVDAESTLKRLTAEGEREVAEIVARDRLDFETRTAAAQAAREQAINAAEKQLAEQRADWWRWDLIRQAEAWLQLVVDTTTIEESRDLSLARIEQHARVQSSLLQDQASAEQWLQDVQRAAAQQAASRQLADDSASDLRADPTVEYRQDLLIQTSQLEQWLIQARQEYAQLLAAATASVEQIEAEAEFAHRQKELAAVRTSTIDEALASFEHTRDVIAARHEEMRAEIAEDHAAAHDKSGIRQQHVIALANADYELALALMQITLQAKLDLVAVDAAEMLSGPATTESAAREQVLRQHRHESADAQHVYEYQRIAADEREAEAMFARGLAQQLAQHAAMQTRARLVAEADAEYSERQASVQSRLGHELLMADTERDLQLIDASTDFAAAEVRAEADLAITETTLQGNHELARQQLQSQWHIGLVEQFIAQIQRWSTGLNIPAPWGALHRALAEDRLVHTREVRSAIEHHSQILLLAEISRISGLVGQQVQRVTTEATAIAELATSQVSADRAQSQSATMAQQQQAMQAAAEAVAFVRNMATADRVLLDEKARAQTAHNIGAARAMWQYRRAASDARLQLNKNLIDESRHQALLDQAALAKRSAEAAAFQDKVNAVGAALEVRTRQAAALQSTQANALARAAVQQSMLMRTAEEESLSHRLSAWRLAYDVLDHAAAADDRGRAEIEGRWAKSIGLADGSLAAAQHQADTAGQARQTLAHGEFLASMSRQHATSLALFADSLHEAAHASAESDPTAANNAAVLRRDMALADAILAEAQRDALRPLYDRVVAEDAEYLASIELAESDLADRIVAAHQHYTDQLTGAILLRSQSMRQALVTMTEQQQQANGRMQQAASVAQATLQEDATAAMGQRAIDEAEAYRQWSATVAQAVATLHIAGELPVTSQQMRTPAQLAYESSLAAADAAWQSALQSAQVTYATALGDALVHRATAMGQAGVVLADEVAATNNQFTTTANAWESTYAIVAAEAERLRTEGIVNAYGVRDIRYAQAEQQWARGRRQLEQDYRSVAGAALIAHRQSLARAEADYHLANAELRNGSGAEFGEADWIALVGADYVQWRSGIAAANLQLENTLATLNLTLQIESLATYADFLDASTNDRLQYAHDVLDARRLHLMTIVEADSLFASQAAYADGQLAHARAEHEMDHDVALAQAQRALIIGRAALPAGASTAALDQQYQSAQIDAELERTIGYADAQLQWTTDLLNAEAWHTRTYLFANRLLQEQLAGADADLRTNLAESTVRAAQSSAVQWTSWAQQVDQANGQWRYQNALVDAQWVSSQLVDQQTVGRGQADALPSTSTIAAATRAAALNDWWSDTSELALDLVTTHNSQSAAFTQQIALQYRTFAEAASAADQTYIASVATGDATYLSELANADAMYGEFLVDPAKKFDLTTAQAERDFVIADALARRRFADNGDEQQLRDALAAADARKQQAIEIARQEYLRQEAIVADSRVQLRSTASQAHKAATTEAAQQHWRTHAEALRSFDDATSDAVESLRHELAAAEHDYRTFAENSLQQVFAALGSGAADLWSDEQVDALDAHEDFANPSAIGPQQDVQALEALLSESQSTDDNAATMDWMPPIGLALERPQLVLQQAAAGWEVGDIDNVVSGTWQKWLALSATDGSAAMRSRQTGPELIRVTMPAMLSRRPPSLRLQTMALLDEAGLATDQVLLRADATTEPAQLIRAAQRRQSGASETTFRKPSAIARFFRDVRLMMQYPGASAAGFGRGAITSSKVAVNGTLSTIKSTVTLGLASAPVELIPVNDEDRAYGYDVSLGIFRVSSELYVGAKIANLAFPAGAAKGAGAVGKTGLAAWQGGRVAKAAFVWDTAQNAVSATKGTAGIIFGDGLTLSNTVEAVGGLVGLGGGSLGRLATTLKAARVRSADEVLDHAISLGVHLSHDADKVGHAFVVLELPSGSKSIFGFYPRDRFDLANAEFIVEFFGKNGGMLGEVIQENSRILSDVGTVLRRIPVSKEAVQAARSFIARVQELAERGEYRYHIASQCATFARQVLREAGMFPFIPIAYPPLMYRTIRLLERLNK